MPSRPHLPQSPAAADARRLRVSPSHALSFALDGRPYLAQEVEPYQQFWLSERERRVHAAFAARGGATVADALAAIARLDPAEAGDAAQRRLRKVVAEMCAAGVLVSPDADTSRYSAAIVQAYLTHRPFPPELAQRIVADGGLVPGRQALDLAGGPGDLAVQLAGSGAEVTLMELSRGFLAGARARARRQGRALHTLHESVNRLPLHDGGYDLVTVSQALHWLDDVQVCRGVCRLLKPGGSFFVVHAAMDVAADHPLAWLFGHDSVLGAKAPVPFDDEVRPLQRRLALLFDALDAPQVQRVLLAQDAAADAGRIVPAAVSLFRQPRPYDEGYARAFLTPRHIEATGLGEAAFWREVRARCQGVPASRLMGTHHWALLQFRRGGAALPAKARWPVAPLPWHGPAAA